jgi:hypothetical protein
VGALTTTATRSGVPAADELALLEGEPEPAVELAVEPDLEARGPYTNARALFPR